MIILIKHLQQVTCGDMTNSEKEDATQTKVTSKIKNLLNLESLEPSLSLQLAVAFVTWISSVLPSEYRFNKTSLFVYTYKVHVY